MHVLLTGVDGYIGVVLAPLLMAAGHEVTGLDTGYYRDGWLFSDARLVPRLPRSISKDLRHIDAHDLAGVDAIIHLAELSNDPLGQNNPDVTYRINHQGSVRLAALARSLGINRFIYTSSCSVYGAGSGEFLDESAETHPQTAYAQCKVLVERDVAAMAGDCFSPTFLRNATAYGPSPRMRFDIVLNNLSALAWVHGRIAMTSDGSPWRPLVHVRDICTAIVCALEAPRDAIHNQVFNVGHNDDNYRVRDIASIVADVFPGCEVTMGPNSGDHRSYRVSFDRIHERLPGFRCDFDARDGACQLRDVFSRIEMGLADFDARPFTRLKQLQYLINTGQLDDALYWQHPDMPALPAGNP
ncbi:MAG: SDR family oxidoreductase [Aquisalimonadaceae bacterium]